MNDMTIGGFGGIGQPQTMSSREIAELTGKRHDHVMRDIRSMLVELHGEGGLPSFGGTYRNEQNGQEYPCFNLPKRGSLILVSGYDVNMRAGIIDRWQVLEDRRSPTAMLNDPSSLRALLLENVEKVIALESGCPGWMVSGRNIPMPGRVSTAMSSSVDRAEERSNGGC